MRLPTEAEIRNVSSVTQLAITTGIILGKQAIALVKYLFKQRGVMLTNAQADEITKAVLAKDEVRKALADAEAGG